MLDYVLPKDTQTFDIEDFSAAEFILNETMDFCLDWRTSPDSIARVSPNKENGVNAPEDQPFHQHHGTHSDLGLNAPVNRQSQSDTDKVSQDNPGGEQVTDKETELRKATVIETEPCDVTKVNFECNNVKMSNDRKHGTQDSLEMYQTHNSTLTSLNQNATTAIHNAAIELANAAQKSNVCDNPTGNKVKSRNCNKLKLSADYRKKECKPNEPYVALIAKAMLASGKTKLTLGEIYKQVGSLIF